MWSVLRPPGYIDINTELSQQSRQMSLFVGEQYYSKKEEYLELNGMKNYNVPQCGRSDVIQQCH